MSNRYNDEIERVLKYKNVIVTDILTSHESVIDIKFLPPNMASKI